MKECDKTKQLHKQPTSYDDDDDDDDDDDVSAF